MKTLNINSIVRIKLTPYGLEVLKSRHKKLRSSYPSIGKLPELDKDGYCEMQLWKIMNIFGEVMQDDGTDMNVPFDFNIQIDGSLLKSVD